VIVPIVSNKFREGDAHAGLLFSDWPEGMSFVLAVTFARTPR
jgi:hypothetical protein